MNRLNEVIKFIEFDKGNGYYLEPDIRHTEIKQRLFDVINTYNPKVIVKAGLGNENLLIEIVRNFNTILVIVEPSMKVIKAFVKNFNGSDELESIRIINGDFHDFPVDYYAADLLICIDHLDFFDSSKALDEFKRALQFHGILFFSGIVLVNDDTEGIYDDFKRIIFPLHNDFYLESDLKTFIELKDFKYIKGTMIEFDRNLKSEIEYFKDRFGDLSIEDALDFIDKYRDDFIQFYSLDDSLNIKEPYFIGCFSRNKPE